MAWNTRPIEAELERRLTNGEDSDIPTADGKVLYAQYITAREKLVEDILPEIKAIESSLTDHGDRHIANVLDNIHKIIGKDSRNVTTMELYFLCLIALFHDVGNIHGRSGHYDKRKIYEIYDYVRGQDSRYDDEKNLIAEVASKHSGKASDGTTDTIKELSEQKEGFWNHGIELRKCAAILRFADECAEGRQRTSNYMMSHHKYDPKSTIHHIYAGCTKVFISRDDNRIALTYSIKIDTAKADAWNETKELLEYIYSRVGKINNERLYNKYYAELLSNFKKVEVVLNFEIDRAPVSIGLKQLVLTDLVVPEGSQTNDIVRRDKAYSIESILEKLQKNSHEPIKI